MDRFLARLQRRYGRYAPGNLTYALVAAQAGGLLLVLVNPESLSYLAFDFHKILAGEIWRVVTWLAVPPSRSPFWALFALYWLYAMGTALESEWGGFKFAVYWLLGALQTMVAAALAGVPTDNAIFTMTLFLAFATLWPNFQIQVYFVLPVKAKWLAYLDALLLVQYSFSRPGLAKLIPLFGVGNYLLFFWPTLLLRLRGFWREASRAGARNRMRRARDESALEGDRQCAICGLSNADPEVELRVCDCQRCGGIRRDLCVLHYHDH
jgi:hypothetical protein